MYTPVKRKEFPYVIIFITLIIIVIVIVIIITIIITTCMNVHEEHGGDVDRLDVEELHRVDGGDGECGGLFVGVVQLVEMLTSRGKMTEWNVCVEFTLYRKGMW